MARTVITVEGDEDLPVASISIRVGNDGSPGALAVINEDGGEATVTVTFTPPLTEASSLGLQVIILGGAYNGLSGPDVIDPDRDIIINSSSGGTRGYIDRVYAFADVPAGPTFEFTLTGVDDVIHNEVGEGYTFTLSEELLGVNYSIHPTNNSVSVHIVDAESVSSETTVSIATSAGVITEGAANNCTAAMNTNCATIIVSLNALRDDDLDVPIVRAVSGLAGTVDPADYTLLSGNTPIVVSGNRFTVRVPAGQTTASFTVTAVDGDGPEENGTLSFTLQPDIPDMDGGVDYIVATSNAVSVTIANDPMDKSTASISVGSDFGDCRGGHSITEVANNLRTNCTRVTVHFNPPVTSAVDIFLAVNVVGGATFNAHANPRFSDVTLGLPDGAFIYTYTSYAGFAINPPRDCNQECS